MATDRPTDAGEAPSPADDPVGSPGSPPDEPRTRAELYAAGRAADRVPDVPRAADEAHTTADGGWAWKSLRLDPPANHVADQQLAARRSAEGRHPDGTYDDRGLTPALRRVEAQLDHGTLIPDTEKFALKSPDRFKEKLAKIDCGQLPGSRSDPNWHLRIHDGIRYTYIFDVPSITAAECRTRHDRAARRAGLPATRLRKPSWDDPEYKGVNSRWQDPGSKVPVRGAVPHSGKLGSQAATHDTYEKIDDPRRRRHNVPELRTYSDRESALELPSPTAAAGFASIQRAGGSRWLRP